MSQQYGYGGQANPYAQQGGGGGLPSGPRAGGLPSGPRGGRANAGPPGGGFRQEYNAPQQSPSYGGYSDSPSMGRDDYGGQNVEMAPLAQNGQRFAGGGGGGDPNAILNECREIDRGVDSIEQNLDRLKMLQQQSLNDADSSTNSATNRQLDAISSETMTMYRNFAGRIKAIKSQPESGTPKNAPQVGKVDRKLKAAINKYQNVESDFRRKMQDQMARQYRIVRPEASEEEVREAVEDTSNQQVFSQALLQSGRQGQSRAALAAVEDRHRAIQKIEQQMIELAELFQDMDVLVTQQEAAVENIEMKGEEVVENMDKGTQEIAVAIESAKSRNRKKWWCLGICVAIIAVIVIVILIYKFVIQGGSTTTTSASTTGKRSLAAQFHENRVINPHNTVAEKRNVVVPGLAWQDNKLVASGTEFKGGKSRIAAPVAEFQSKKALAAGVRFRGGAVRAGVDFQG
ncbi:hypothetical protein BP6252_03691 [Coleophoma cylindrospora]|uniref:t-SNARE coiled-coil homology domain-containing protein n=1 Tax=Coleophoma cylindrospora TaxID=1849047 RepID=A0A3D8S8C6_9HELO|nr:hypothetical protein BP6252_03691 [Coleophoma cylindrospora]